MSEKEKKGRFSLGEVATQTQPVIIDSEEKDEAKSTYTIEKAIVKIMNDLDELKELL